MQRHFHEELDALKQTLLAMGGLVEDQIRRVMSALIERDGELAQEVIPRRIWSSTRPPMASSICLSASSSSWKCRCMPSSASTRTGR